MSQLNLLQTRLAETYATWANLGTTDQLRKKINPILPVIQIVSYLKALHEINDDAVSTESYKNILQDFAGKYSEIYGKDIAKMNSSDLAPELMERLRETQNGGPQLTDLERESLINYEDKYIHAHNRVMFNYGVFLHEVTEKLSPENTDKIADQFTEIKTSEDPEVIIKNLIEINKLFNVELHSAIIVKDDLENHALLNQMSNWLTHIAQVPGLLLDEESHAKANETILQPAGKFTVKRDSDFPDPEIIAESERHLQSKGISGAVGIETEFLLRELAERRIAAPQYSSPSSQNEVVTVEDISLEEFEDQNEVRRQNTQDVAIKRAVADLNARRKMQIKYLGHSDIPEISDATVFFSSNNFPDKSGIAAIGRSDFNQITRDLKQYIPQEQHEFLETQISKFTPEEAFFYKLFFLSDNLPERTGIDMDGVYNPRLSEDLAENKAANIEKIWGLISKGKFHESCLDMIQAHEVSVGPHATSEVIAKKNEALNITHSEPLESP